MAQNVLEQIQVADFFSSLKCILKLFSFSSVEAPQGPVGHIVCTEKGILAVEKKSILLPPLWNKIFSWGFSDFTCCLADSGSDKVITSYRLLPVG